MRLCTRDCELLDVHDCTEDHQQALALVFWCACPLLDLLCQTHGVLQTHRVSIRTLPDVRCNVA